LTRYPPLASRCAIAGVWVGADLRVCPRLQTDQVVRLHRGSRAVRRCGATAELYTRTAGVRGESSSSGWPIPVVCQRGRRTAEWSALTKYSPRRAIPRVAAPASYLTSLAIVRERETPLTQEQQVRAHLATPSPRRKRDARVETASLGQDLRCRPYDCRYTIRPRSRRGRRWRSSSTSP
jgi:hypothetical protein